MYRQRIKKAWGHTAHRGWMAMDSGLMLIGWRLVPKELPSSEMGPLGTHSFLLRMSCKTNQGSRPLASKLASKATTTVHTLLTWLIIGWGGLP